MKIRPNPPLALAWLAGTVFLAGAAAAGEDLADSVTAAREFFRQGRYAEAYAAFWPALERGEPEAVFYGLIIRRHGLDGRPPAQDREMEALTGLLAGRAAFMRQALRDGELPEPVADAYRTALAQLVFFGRLPLESPPPDPAEVPARRRAEALASLTALARTAPATRFTPAMNFAAWLRLNPATGTSQPKVTLALARKSAAAGDRLGMLNLSLCYREGLGTARDSLKAAHWARRAAEAQPPPARALNEVGYFYETGRGVTRDLTEARAWYDRSAARGHKPGQCNAARLKNRGAGPPALEAEIMF